MASSQIRGWGNTLETKQSAIVPLWSQDFPMENYPPTFLAHGLGRSYGDSCLISNGTMMMTKNLNRFVSFNSSTGVLRCEAGVSLEQIKKYFLPKGWFVPTTPGTKFVTIGGAIANDIHGKNHHCVGTFGCHVHSIKLMRSTGEKLDCSHEKNSNLFHASIGGLGLTGLILEAEIQLQRVPGPWIVTEKIPFFSLKDYLKINLESETRFEHTVAWVDSLWDPKKGMRGIFIRGNYSNQNPSNRLFPKEKKPLIVPLDFPSFALNPVSIGIFNKLYFWANSRQKQTELESFDTFFYPLDAILHWNRIYGEKGFFQYQCVIPSLQVELFLPEIFRIVAHSKQGSFLTVVKTFGNTPSPGILSFPMPGITVTFDFPNRGKKTLKLLQDLDTVTEKAGGRVYPAKDARMTGDAFRRFFPRWQELEALRDPQFNSEFWKRVNKDYFSSQSEIPA